MRKTFDKFNKHLNRFEKKWNNRPDGRNNGNRPNTEDRFHDPKGRGCTCDKCPVHNATREYKTRQNSLYHACGEKGHWAGEYECSLNEENKRKNNPSVDSETKPENPSLN